MGIQLIPLIAGEDRRGDGDGKSLARVFIALQMEGDGSRGGGRGRVTRVDFRTRTVISDEVVEVPARAPATDHAAALEAFISQDPRATRHDHERAISAAGALQAYLRSPAGRRKVLALDGMDEDYVDGAIAELDNLIAELREARGRGLPYCLWLSV